MMYLRGLGCAVNLQKHGQLNRHGTCGTAPCGLPSTMGSVRQCHNGYGRMT